MSDQVNKAINANQIINNNIGNKKSYIQSQHRRV